MCFLPPIGMMRRAPAAGGAPNLIADFDFSAPLASWTSGRTGFSSAFATDEWLMQDASSPMANNVGSETLANDTGLVNQSCPVIHDGTGYGNRKCWESGSTADNPDSLVASGTTAGDSDGDDFCFRLVFRLNRPIESSNYIFSKRDGGGAGWNLLSATIGRWFFVLEDSSTNTFSAISPNNSIGQDGGLEYVTGWYDASANTAYIKSRLGAEASVDTTGMGSISNAIALCINDRDEGAGALGQAGMQVIYAGVCVGDDAQAMYDETFWQHAQKPALLDALDRDCVVGAPLAAAYIGLFAPDTFPVDYDPSLAAGAGGLGVYCNNARTNLVPYSVLSTGATNTNVTATDNDADSPLGFREATTLLATAANGNQKRVCTTTILTQYTATVYIEEVTAGVAGRVIMYNETTPGENASTAFVGTGTPQVVSVTATTGAAQVSTSVRVEVDTDTETAIAYAWQLETGSGTGAIIPTSGAAASLVQSNYRATGNYVQESEGELTAVFCIKKMPASGETHYVFDTVTAADRRALFVDDTGALKFLVNDGAGSAVATVTLGTVAADTEYTARCQWDEAAGLGTNSVRGKLDAASAVVGGSSFTSGSGFTAEICFGASDTTANTALDGFIASIESYDAAEAIS